MKTASTSVDIAFSCNADGEDIVTPVAPEDEVIRRKQGGQFPCNWAWESKSEQIFRQFSDQFERDGTRPKTIFGKPKKFYRKSQAKFFNHITPTLLAKRVGAQFVKDAFMVTMVRHPYEVVLSYASHISQKKNSTDIQRYIEKTLWKKPINDKFLFTEFAPDFVIRFENMPGDLAVLEDKFGLTLNDSLPFTKHKFRKDKKHAKGVLTDTQKERCYAKYRQQFDTFGYKP